MMVFRNNYSSANNININMSCIYEMYITSQSNLRKTFSSNFDVSIEESTIEVIL